jgi:alkylation response protein AidB-like acyl-CoA dehydrogenase
MSTANHYRSNLRDIYFNLFEYLKIQDTILGKGPFTLMDEAASRDALVGFETFAREQLSPCFQESDRVPLKLDDDGNVTLPPGLRACIEAYFEAEWNKLELPEHMGGYAAPPTMCWALFELMAGANASATFYLFGSFISRLIDRLGTPGQKQRFARAIERSWGGSMVLTEPDAGSDVGAGRTKARHLHDDVWEIEGVKRFITNGDFDATENIIHAVLARPEGAAPGTRGLSLFLVPKYWVEEDGSLGERNGVYVRSIEKKMGIKGSATCEMTFGERKQCRGLLMGNVHDGIRQMFNVIEYARMAVGMKSMATLSTAYLNSLEFTRMRIQGADMTEMLNKDAPRVAIIRHPDVRRMLITQKAFAEGMRALCLFTAHIQDQVEMLGGHGDHAADGLDRLNDLLLPLVKGYCSEKVYELLSLSLQCLGGSGYVTDYPHEQYIRDQKIDSLYEGVTHIQALDLFFRKIGRDRGATLNRLFDRIRATVNNNQLDASFMLERLALGRALAECESIVAVMGEKVAESFYHAGFQGNRVLFALAELVIGWLLIDQAALANEKLPGAGEADRDFYTGKLAIARWYASNVLPGLSLTRELIEQGGIELMSFPDSAF